LNVQFQQKAQLSQRDRAAGWVKYGQKWKTGTRRQYLRTQLFSLDNTAKALREKIDQKSAMSLKRGHFDPKFQVKGDVPTNNFCMDS